MLKLNLGCGQNLVKGMVNVDKDGAPDLKYDLEVFPWPWPDNSVDEILLYHALEHMGERFEVFVGIMKALYRVCCNGAVIHIAVPHPRHDDFIDDPTHVRIVTPQLLTCFSKRLCIEAQKIKAPNSPLALYHGVDFEIAGVTYTLDAPYDADMKAGRLTNQAAIDLMRRQNNVAREWRIDLKAVKP